VKEDDPSASASASASTSASVVADGVGRTQNDSLLLLKDLFRLALCFVHQNTKTPFFSRFSHLLFVKRIKKKKSVFLSSPSIESLREMIQTKRRTKRRLRDDDSSSLL